VAIQRNSFLHFLEKGLIEEFSKRNPITNMSNTLEIFFYPEYYQLAKPKYSTREAIIKGKSYSSRLYMPVQLTDKKSRIIKFKWVYLGDLPIMTKRGHFIINGAARVIVNQIIRSPGIYYQTKIYENFATPWAEKPESFYERHYADLICQRGTWLRLEIDKEKKIWAQTKRGPKMPIMWLLIAMGLSEKMIFKSVLDPQRLIYNMNGFALAKPISEQDPNKSVLLKQNRSSSVKSKTPEYVKTPPEAWAKIYTLFTKQKNTVESATANQAQQNQNIDPQDWVLTALADSSSTQQNQDNSKTKELSKDAKIKKQNRSADSQKSGSQTQTSSAQNRKDSKVPFNVSDLGRQLIFNKFMNPRTYDLSKHGRLNFNKKLSLSVSPYQTTLTPQDLLAATDYLLKVEYGLKKVDDIDHLKNRRVRTSGELIQIQLGTGLVRLEKSIKEKMDLLYGFALGLKSPKAKPRFTNKVSKSQSKKGPDFMEQKNKKSIGLSKLSTTKPKGVSNNSVLLKQNLGLALAQSASNQTSAETLANSVAVKQNLPSDAPETFNQVKSFNLTKTLKLLPKQYNNQNFSESNSSKKATVSINSLINTKPVNSALREFFGTSPLSQFMDQINPLAELTHKRRLSSMGPGGVTRDSATLDIRGIHPSHYGRICPIETPEGKNTGLVNSLTTYARVNSQGYIETPFYKVYKGQVQLKTGMFFFSAEQEDKIKLGASDLAISDIGFLSTSNIPVRIQDEFSKISRDFVEYVGISPLQMVSIATSLIPFLEHDDANRALMGSNMQRQAVPILKPERPIVGTGLEARAVSDSGHALQSKTSGLITYVSADKLVIYG
jgi:DNA-directed RNA polymerase beta subunit